ncbi:MAG TPA: hypothetical protein PLS81_09915 [Deltaproteobacteria bacterium]|nr:hypothetical protein [Deltaproteobacteria bacterium]HPP79832.1 hypothetical protein [Deltaproteobacteria bacterium]
MSPVRRRHKKSPRYLEDLTYSVAEGGIAPENPFVAQDLFLGRYNESQVMEKLAGVGMIDLLKSRGYNDLVVQIFRQDGFTSRFYVNFGSPGSSTRLIELVVREGVFRPTETFIPGYDFSDGLAMLLIEWMALQDPRASFSRERPRLPGQQYPGLGGLKKMQALLYELGKETGKEAIVDVPEYFHAAAIYSRLYTEIYDRKYAFFSPIDAGIMNAILRDVCVEPRGLADVSFAIAFDCLLDGKTLKPVTWRSSEQVYPISNRLQRYIDDERYKRIVHKTMEERSFAMDWERYDKIKERGLLDAL